VGEVGGDDGDGHEDEDGDERASGAQAEAADAVAAGAAATEAGAEADEQAADEQEAAAGEGDGHGGGEEAEEQEAAAPQAEDEGESPGAVAGAAGEEAAGDAADAGDAAAEAEQQHGGEADEGAAEERPGEGGHVGGAYRRRRAGRMGRMRARAVMGPGSRVRRALAVGPCMMAGRMRLVRRGLLAVLLVVLLIAGFLAVKPAPIDPLAWDPPAVPELTGPLAPNSRLAAAEHIGVGVIDGPEDVETDARGRIYAGTNAGTIVRVDGEKIETFADTGGRPLGLDFAADGALIVADAVKGLLSVGPDGGITTLCDAVDGVKLGFTDDVAVASDGTIYFSDASAKFGFGDHMLDLLEGRAHGKLIAYGPKTGGCKLLLGGLYFANGVALAQDESFVAVNETYRYRVTRYWLKGPQAGTSDVLVEGLPGFPDGIAASGRGTFWVAMFTVRNPMGDFLAPRPLLRKMVANLPRALWPAPAPYGLVIEVDERGRVVQSLQDPGGEHVQEVTSVHERDGALLLGHLHRDRIDRVKL
jgi:sugar lactone lactonase YvrE